MASLTRKIQRAKMLKERKRIKREQKNRSPDSSNPERHVVIFLSDLLEEIATCDDDYDYDYEIDSYRYFDELEQ